MYYIMNACVGLCKICDLVYNMSSEILKS